MKQAFGRVLIIAALCQPLLRADQGTTAASYLKLGTSARGIAMADAFGGVSDDVSAIQYNPSGLAFMTNKELTLMHAVWFQDIFYDYGALAWPIQGIGTIGLSVFYLNAGKFDEYTFDALNQPVRVGEFSASALTAALSYARAIVPSISMGLSIKMINETIQTSSTGSMAVDIAAMYKTPFPGLTLGANVANLGPSLGYDQAFSLPITFRFGVGYKPSGAITVAMDYNQPIETAGVWSLGAEYGYRDTLYVRMGYRYQGAVDYNQTYVGYGPSVASGLAMGLGLKLYKDYSADYAYSPYGFLGSTHRVSLSARFN